MKSEGIEKLQALLDAATPGEWVRVGRSWSIAALVPEISPDPVCIVSASSGADTELICAMKNTLPELLAAVRERDEAQDLAIKRGEIQVRLTKERDALQKQLAVEVAVNADYPDVVQERDALRAELDEMKNGVHDCQNANQLLHEAEQTAERYLDALKAEACSKQLEEDRFSRAVPERQWVGEIQFDVTRKPDGSLEATEVE